VLLLFKVFSYSTLLLASHVQPDLISKMEKQIFWLIKVHQLTLISSHVLEIKAEIQTETLYKLIILVNLDMPHYRLAHSLKDVLVVLEPTLII
jgi:hypothetical protein